MKKKVFNRSKQSSKHTGKGQANIKTPKNSQSKIRKSRKISSGKPGSAFIKSGGSLIRLNRYIASTGLCSRREADKYISDGLIKVNNKVITELGTKISPNDRVKFGGETLKSERFVYILLNKPKDYVTTTDDPHERKTVIELVRNACSERVYPVGRLDRKTTGVLLLTNDGDLTTRLTHPKFRRKKIYHVYLNKALNETHKNQIYKGIKLEDGMSRADKISYVDQHDKSQVGLEIHSGKNRIIRRIFEHFGYYVVKLDRVYFAGLTKKNLRRGQWRFLTKTEVDILKRSSH